ncbi:oligosaccharide repeat unit polymerase [Citrobacter freundii]|uniref:oligosaccharide repeat unit polymerase n=1 Tax=Citrobacter freundii TaxID=546 RepID=UPI0015F46146|nr:oligosaccharide repeat unit polymerase [Citrobacter freundii]
MLGCRGKNNPEFNFFLWLYICFNVACVIYFSCTGLLGGDFANEYIASPFWLIVALIVVLATFYFISCFLFNLFCSIKVTRYTQSNSIIIDIFLTIVIVLSIYLSVVYKIGVYGLDPDDLISVPSFLKQIYSITQPIHLGIIYLFYRVGNFKVLTYVNLILYIVLFLVSGQTNQFILIFALYLFYRNTYAKPINKNKLIILTMLGIMFYPVFRLLKVGIVGSQRDDTELIQFATTIGSDFFSYYSAFLFVTLERFQIVANISFILERFHEVYHDYSLLVGQGNISNFFTSNWIIKFIMNTLGFDIDINVQPQTFLALLINGREFWSSHIGLLGYFVFYGMASIIIYLFILAVMAVSVILCKKMTKGNGLLLLCQLLTLIIICHGWLMAYVFFLQALIIFYIFLYIVRGVSNIYVPPNRMLKHV